MSIHSSDVVKTFSRESTLELAAATGIIRHCLEQLNEEQLWWRPDGTMNSVGNLILHLCGNLRQWVISGVGGATDTRRRQQEFDARGPIPAAELLSAIEATTQAASEVLSRVTGEELLEERRIQGFTTTGLGAVIHSISHFRGHVQEIVHLSRTVLGSAYEFDFVPANTPPGD